MRRLELRPYNGAWLDADQIDVLERQATANRQAESKYASRVQKWTKLLQRGSVKQADFVHQQLDEHDDRAIIPVLEKYMSPSGAASALVVVDWLKRHPHDATTQSLLRHALHLPCQEVNQAAIAALAQRPLHDYVPPLLGLLIPPIETQFRICVSPYGSVIHRHELYRAGRANNDLAQWNFTDTAWKARLELDGARWATPIRPSTRLSVSVSRGVAAPD